MFSSAWIHPGPERKSPSRFRVTRAVTAAVTALPWVATAAVTNSPDLAPPLPTIGPSLIRLLGAFSLVLVLTFGVLWFLRRGVRWTRRGQSVSRKLSILEVRALGNRQSLFVAGYENQRFLLASTTGGISLLTHLPEAPADSAPEPQTPITLVPHFAEVLQHAFSRKA